MNSSHMSSSSPFSGPIISEASVGNMNYHAPASNTNLAASSTPEKHFVNGKCTICQCLVGGGANNVRQHFQGRRHQTNLQKHSSSVPVVANVRPVKLQQQQQQQQEQQQLVGPAEFQAPSNPQYGPPPNYDMNNMGPHFQAPPAVWQQQPPIMGPFPPQAPPGGPWMQQQQQQQQQQPWMGSSPFFCPPPPVPPVLSSAFFAPPLPPTSAGYDPPPPPPPPTPPTFSFTTAATARGQQQQKRPPIPSLLTIDATPPKTAMPIQSGPILLSPVPTSSNSRPTSGPLGPGSGSGPTSGPLGPGSGSGPLGPGSGSGPTSGPLGPGSGSGPTSGPLGPGSGPPGSGSRSTSGSGSGPPPGPGSGHKATSASSIPGFGQLPGRESESSVTNNTTTSSHTTATPHWQKPTGMKGWPDNKYLSTTTTTTAPSNTTGITRINSPYVFIRDNRNNNNPDQRTTIAQSAGYAPKSGTDHHKAGTFSSGGDQPENYSNSKSVMVEGASSEFFCPLCRIRTRNVHSFRVHLQCALHIQNAKEKGQKFKTFKCDICNIRGMEYSDENFMKHLTSKEHLAVKAFILNDLIRPAGASSPLDDPAAAVNVQKQRTYIFKFSGRGGGLVECTLCNRVFPTAAELLSHQQNESHAKKLTALDEKYPVLYLCQLCEESSLGKDAYMKHMRSQKHLIAVQRSVGEDCPAYYRLEICKMGDHCPYRHSPSALSTDAVCQAWVFSKCTLPACPFRHPCLNPPISNDHHDDHDDQQKSASEMGNTTTNIVEASADRDQLIGGESGGEPSVPKDLTGLMEATPPAINKRQAPSFTPADIVLLKKMVESKLGKPIQSSSDRAAKSSWSSITTTADQEAKSISRQSTDQGAKSIGRQSTDQGANSIGRQWPDQGKKSIADQGTGGAKSTDRHGDKSINKPTSQQNSSNKSTTPDLDKQKETLAKCLKGSSSKAADAAEMLTRLVELGSKANNNSSTKQVEEREVINKAKSKPKSRSPAPRVEDIDEESNFLFSRLISNMRVGGGQSSEEETDELLACLLENEKRRSSSSTNQQQQEQKLKLLLLQKLLDRRVERKKTEKTIMDLLGTLAKQKQHHQTTTTNQDSDSAAETSAEDARELAMDYFLRSAQMEEAEEEGEFQEQEEQEVQCLDDEMHGADQSMVMDLESMINDRLAGMAANFDLGDGFGSSSSSLIDVLQNTPAFQQALSQLTQHLVTPVQASGSATPIPMPTPTSGVPPPMATIGSVTFIPPPPDFSKPPPPLPFAARGAPVPVPLPVPVAAASEPVSSIPAQQQPITDPPEDQQDDLSGTEKPEPVESAEPALEMVDEDMQAALSQFLTTSEPLSISTGLNVVHSFSKQELEAHVRRYYDTSREEEGDDDQAPQFVFGGKDWAAAERIKEALVQACRQQDVDMDASLEAGELEEDVIRVDMMDQGQVHDRDRMQDRRRREEEARSSRMGESSSTTTRNRRGAEEDNWRRGREQRRSRSRSAGGSKSTRRGRYEERRDKNERAAHHSRQSPIVWDKNDGDRHSSPPISNRADNRRGRSRHQPEQRLLVTIANEQYGTCLAGDLYEEYQETLVPN